MKTIVDILHDEAAQDPAFPLFSYHDFEGNTKTIMTLGELYQKASCVAHLLKGIAEPQARIVLIFDPGLPFIYAFLGCLMAGMVAIPMLIPKETTHAKPIQDFFEQTKASAILTNEESVLQLNFFLNLFLPDISIPCIGVEGLDFSEKITPSEMPIKSEDLAYLQHTSGLTHVPKEVMISHGNIMNQLIEAQEFFELSKTDKMGFWLSHAHYMGLVMGILLPIYAKVEAHFMRRDQFHEVPFRFVKMVSDEKLTVTFGTSSGYHLCVQKTLPQERDTLDLHHWRMACVGGEHICKDVLEHFAAYFSSCGFRMEAFSPEYGLSEATLFVSGKKAGEELHFMDYGQLVKRPLEQSRPEGAHVKSCTSSGKISKHEKVLIVNPDTKEVVEDDTEGEIWVGGDHAALGYWKNPEKTEDTFHAHLAKGDTQTLFLRTGDLGVIHHEELYITGRIKELIIIQGISYSPEDIEWSSEHAHPDLQGCPAAAFSIENEGKEVMVVVQEIKSDYDHELISQEVFEAIRKKILDEYHIAPAVIILVFPGSLLRTYRGKIQRYKAREAFLNNTLYLIGEWHQKNLRLSA